jgi:hypothetical protein
MSVIKEFLKASGIILANEILVNEELLPLVEQRFGQEVQPAQRVQSSSLTIPEFVLRVPGEVIGFTGTGAFIHIEQDLHREGDLVRAGRSRGSIQIERLIGPKTCMGQLVENYGDVSRAGQNVLVIEAENFSFSLLSVEISSISAKVDAEDMAICAGLYAIFVNLRIREDRHHGRSEALGGSRPNVR